MVAKVRQTTKKEEGQNIFFSVLIGVLLFGVVGFFIVSNLNISKKRSDMIGTIEYLQGQIQALEQKNLDLKAGIIETETDIYWEEKAREQGYKKPGEEAVVVLPPEDQGEGAEVEAVGFWQKILNFFSRD